MRIYYLPGYRVAASYVDCSMPVHCRTSCLLPHQECTQSTQSFTTGLAARRSSAELPRSVIRKCPSKCALSDMLFTLCAKASALRCRFVGEWKDYHGYAENNDAHDTAMKCFTVAGIYGGTLVLSVIGLVYHGRKK